MQAAGQVPDVGLRRPVPARAARTRACSAARRSARGRRRRRRPPCRRRRLSPDAPRPAGDAWAPRRAGRGSSAASWRCSPSAGGGAGAAPRAERRRRTRSSARRRPTLRRPPSDLHQRFGDDAIYVLVREPVTQLVLTADLERVLGARGLPRPATCRPGRQPPGGAGGPCGRLAATKPVQVVFGPGTFLNEAVGQIQDQFTAQTPAARRAGQAGGGRGAQARAAPAATRAPTAKRLAQQAEPARQRAVPAGDRSSSALQYGLSGGPERSTTRSSSRALVFDSTPGPGTPKARFAYIFPTATARCPGPAAARAVRRPSARQAIADVRAAVAMPQWRLQPRAHYTSPARRWSSQDLTTSISPLDRAAARRRAGRHGAMLALVFRARAAAAAAAGRARGGGADVRGDLAGRGVADDGLDRRAAGAHRPRGRLRDPAPVARRGGAPAGGAQAADAAAATAPRAAAPDDRHRGRGHRRRLPRARAVAGADGARLRAAARRRHRARAARAR